MQANAPPPFLSLCSDSLLSCSLAVVRDYLNVVLLSSVSWISFLLLAAGGDGGDEGARDHKEKNGNCAAPKHKKAEEALLESSLREKKEKKGWTGRGLRGGSNTVTASSRAPHSCRDGPMQMPGRSFCGSGNKKW